MHAETDQDVDDSEFHTLQGIADLVADAVVVVHSDGTVRHVNDSACCLFEAPEGSLIGQQADRLLGGVAATARTVAARHHVVMVLQPPDAPATASEATEQRLRSLESALRHISWELQSVGFDVRPAPAAALIGPETLSSLSRREREVLDTFLTVSTVSQTATELHVSEHTVRSHMKAIYRKFGVRSQTELVMRLRNSGRA